MAAVVKPKVLSLQPPKPVLNEELIRLAVEDDRKEEELGWSVKEDPMGGLSWEPIELPRVEELRLSHRGLSVINNLQTLDALRVLRLDNNHFTKIENIGHLVNLEWLDLSFNEITEIEGLSTLTKLTDLLLSHNKITTVKGLDSLTQLETVSLGDNQLSRKEDLEYLRKLETLKCLTLNGNPLAQGDAEYRTKTLAYIPQLLFLDWVSVSESDRRTAGEHAQTLLELKEADEARQATKQEQSKAQERALRLRTANLDVIATITDTIFADDEDGQRLCVFPEVSDLQAAYKDKLGAIASEGTEKGFDSWEKAKTERDSLQRVLDSTRQAGDEASRNLVTTLNKLLKRTRAAFETFDEATSDMSMTDWAVEQVENLRSSADSLKSTLLTRSLALNEQGMDLISEFETHYTTLMQERADLFNSIFRAAEKEEVAFKDSVTSVLQGHVERFASESKDEGEEDDGLEDELRAMLSDREALMNNVTSSHDAHMGKLLAAEDDVRAKEKEHTSGVLTALSKQEGDRHRERIAEVIALHKHYMKEAQELLTSAIDE